MRVYVAGPMTGKPLYNFPAFDAAKARWEAAGHNVTTPADITREAWDAEHGRAFDPASDACEYGSWALCSMFSLDLAAVCAAHVIALLPGWEQSKGARIEIAVAKQLGNKSFMCAETFMPMSLAVDVQVNNEITHVA